MRVVLCSLLSVALWAGDRPATTQGANSQVAIEATLIMGRDAVKAEVGSDLGGYFILVKTTVKPQGGHEVAISPDDFILHTDKDGEKSTALPPGQIAGRGAIVLTEQITGVVGTDTVPVWGPGSRGGTWPGQSGGMGNGATVEGVDAKVNHNSKSKDDPVLAKLKQEALPTKTSKEPVTGLLYFQLEGKQKVKQLELRYKGPGGDMVLRFK